METLVKNVVEKCIKAAGGQDKLARIAGVTQPAVAYWKKIDKIPADYVPRISRKLNIPKAIIRPDLFNGKKSGRHTTIPRR